jgi:hypothetical protein
MARTAAISALFDSKTSDKFVGLGIGGVKSYRFI